MPRVIFFPQSNTCIVYFLDLKTRLDLKFSQYPWSHAVAVTSRSTEYIPYAGSTSKKFFLGLELPNEVSLASKRPLVTPKRCGSLKNDRDPPWSSRPSSVFFVPGGILPVRSHVEGGSSARSLHRRRYHLGLKIQVEFKGEWVRARLVVRR